MEAGYLGIGLVLVIGIAVVVYGWLSDRTDTKRRQAALTQTPDRPIPGLATESSAPNYITEYEALHRPDQRLALTDTERARLQKRLTSSPSMPHGHASAEFATDPGSGLCVLDAPLILVVDAELTTIRELLPFFERTRTSDRRGSRGATLRQAQGSSGQGQGSSGQGQGTSDQAQGTSDQAQGTSDQARGSSGQARGTYVLVAPAIAKEVLTTLRVNAATRTLAGTVVLLPDPDQRRVLCSLVGARPLQLDDLRSGYLPDSALGTCGTWVSSTDRLWILSDPVGLDQLDQPEGSARG